ncbi:hypothetical protein [Thalassotalea agariperforans]
MKLTSFIVASLALLSSLAQARSSGWNLQNNRIAKGVKENR